MFRIRLPHPVSFSIQGTAPGKSAVPRLALRFLAVGQLILGAIASAQTPPSQLIPYEDPTGVWVRYSHCASSDYKNCDINFGLYRSTSPGSNYTPINTCLASSGNSTSDTCQDKTATAGQTYTYRLCTGGAALSDLTNCATSSPFTVPKPTPPPQAPALTLTAGVTSLTKGTSTSLTWNSVNTTSLDLEPGIGKVNPSGSTQVTPLQTTTYTLTAHGGGYTTKATVTITVPCFTQWAPPANLSAVVGSEVHLKWTNPVTDPYGTCPAPSTQVLIYRYGANGPQQIAALAKTGNPGTLPGQYTDSSLLLPHTSYEYAVCEGGPADWQSPTNCAFLPGALHSIVTWGADPVLSAVRDGANSVKLKLALDQATTLSSIVVTRQGSDDPCRQGGTLGNGLQGCKTVGPNGGSPAQTVTVYNWTESSASQLPPGFQNSQSAPFVINLPDDTTVKPAVEYYYLAQVTWLSTIGQQSNTVTVPNAYTSATLQQGIGSGIKLKPLGSAPPPPPQSSAPPAAMASPTSPALAPAPPSMMRMGMAPPPTTAPAPPPSQMPMARPMMMAPAGTAASPMLQSSSGPSSAPLLAQPGMTTNPSLAQSSPFTSNLSANIKQVQQKPHDAQALYALGKAYCASNQKNTGVSYMYMALLLAEQTGNAPLAGQIKSSLSEQGVNMR